MAPTLNSQDDRAAFVDACIDTRKKPLQVWESLGLISENSHDDQHGYFVNKGKSDEAYELQSVVEGIAKSFAMSYRGTTDELHSCLAEEDAFSDDVLRLGQEYGAKIWGRLEEGELRLSCESQGNGIEEQDWDDPQGRKNILFYMRCWIICIVAKELTPTPRRGKGKGRVRESGSFGDQQNQDTVQNLAESNSPSPPGVSFRAPEPRMYPTPEPRRETSFTGASHQTSRIVLSSATHGRSNSNTTPTKRKAPESDERMPLGKLPRSSKGVRKAPVLAQERRDPYSGPFSPPAFTSLNQSSCGRQVQRETTYDTDVTWRPREATADTETVVDGDEEHVGEMDSCIPNDTATPHRDDDMQYEYEDETAAGPSGTYRNPLRQDSVIPNDTQVAPDTIEAGTRPSSGQPRQHEDEPSDALTDAIIRSLISDPSPATTRQTRAYRLELCKLLVSYLNSIEQFDPSCYDCAAEERMDLLLNQFRCTDADTWPADHNDNDSDSAIRMHLAFEKWMGMRHRLAAFRNATGYFGPPGRQWEGFLRGLDDVPFAKAILAFLELKGDGGRDSGAGYGFDDDLMAMFYGLTRVEGCMGPEAFKGVRKFNEGLVEWFGDE